MQRYSGKTIVEMANEVRERNRRGLRGGKALKAAHKMFGKDKFYRVLCAVEALED